MGVSSPQPPRLLVVTGLVTYLTVLFVLVAMPKAPTNVQVSDVTATSARLSWEPAVDDSAGTIESYIIQYRRKYAPGTSYEEITDVLDTEFVVTGLNPYTTYEMRVTAVNNIGRGLPSRLADVPTGETSKLLIIM